MHKGKLCKVIFSIKKKKKRNHKNLHKITNNESQRYAYALAK